jgi:hypothetical protein
MVGNEVLTFSLVLPDIVGVTYKFCTRSSNNGNPVIVAAVRVFVCAFSSHLLAAD